MDFDWFYKLQGIKIFLSSADIYPQFSTPLPHPSSGEIEKLLEKLLFETTQQKKNCTN